MKNLILENIKLHWTKWLVVILLMLFLASLITYKIPLPAAEDLPRQMANGRDILQGNWEVLTQNYYSYTEPNHYFANHHWLYGVFVYFLYNLVGWSGMVVFKIIFILLTFSLLFFVALKKANFWLVSIVSVPTIFMLAGRSDLRPELFGFFFIPAYIYFFYKLEENPKTNLILLLVPLQLLWANLHITFPIGVMLVGGFLVEKFLLDQSVSFWTRFSLKGFIKVIKSPIISKLIIVLLTVAAVSFVNPLGIKGVVYSLTANIGSSADSPVKSSEVQSVSSTIDDLPKWASIPFALSQPMMLILGLSFLIGFRKKPIFYILASAGASFLAYFVLRGLPFLGIFFLLAVTINFNDYFIRLKLWLISKWQIGKNLLDPGLNLILVLGLILLFSLNYSNFLFGHEVGVGIERNSEDSAKFFIDNNLKGPVLNDTDIGSYLTYYLYPKERIYTDNRFGDAYSNEFFKNDYADAVSDEKIWEQVLYKYNFNTIFMYQYDQGYNMRDFLYRRIRDPRWVWVYGDRFAVILVRNIPENQEVIKKYSINFDNAAERFKSLSEHYDGYNQIALGDLYSLMGDANLALANYAVAVAEKPELAKIWFTMGKTELQRADTENSNPAIALMYLKQAIDRGWKTTNSYSFLALAYYRLGQIDKAEEAVKEELKINPKSKDAQVWVNNIVKARAAQLKK